MAQEEQTCGKGLAENSALPGKLSELIAALAGVLETHMKALDVTDENSLAEHTDYDRLVHQYRETAAQLAASAREMAGYRDLAMGRQDTEALAGGEQTEAFKRYVRVEREILVLLQDKLS